MEVATQARKPGRPSHYPVVVRYHEREDYRDVMQGFADRQGLSFSEVQRLVNRAGLQALKLSVAA